MHRHLRYVLFLLAAVSLLAVATWTTAPRQTATAAAPSPRALSTTAAITATAPFTAGDNPVALENAKAGSAAWKLSNPATGGEIEGYASLTSVNKGGRIAFYVRTAAPSFSVDVYRMGYYQGAGARLMVSRDHVPAKAQPMPCLNADQVIECNWSVNMTLTIPDAEKNPAATGYWTSGIYLAKLTAEDNTKKDSYIIFVVRDDARAARYVSQLPVTTYQAYNYWGGKSLYTGCGKHSFSWACADGAKPATAVSFNRPYTANSNPNAAYGTGAGEFIANFQPVNEGYDISSAAWDYNMVRWMEKQNYDIKYISSIDLHEAPGVLAHATAFISTGHDEYYSRTMRDKLSQARDAGTNLAFFSSNQIYWQVRFKDGSYGPNKANRIMICYRVEKEPRCFRVLSYIGIDRFTVCYQKRQDPVRAGPLATGKFRDMGYAESALIGNQYTTNPVTSSVIVTAPAHWLFNRAQVDGKTVLPGLRGYEVNTHTPGISPVGTTILTHSVTPGSSSDTTYYIAPSHAQVFAVESMQWAWGLDDFNAPQLRDNYVNKTAQKITQNIFDAIGEESLFSLSADDAAQAMIVKPLWWAAQYTVALDQIDPADKNGLWRIIAADDTAYDNIVARASGDCLGGDPATGVALQRCDRSDRQQWRIVASTPDKVSLVEKKSGRCLARNASGTASRLALVACAGIDDASDDRLWRRTAFNPGR